jgi:hypothetical protein
MSVEVAIMVCPASSVLDVVVPFCPWPDTMAEDADWFATWPLGRTEARDAFVNGRAVTSPLPDGNVAFFVQCDAETMLAMLAIATTSWPSIGTLSADTGAEALAVKAGWLGEELVIDGRIAGYLDVPVRAAT